MNSVNTLNRSSILLFSVLGLLACQKPQNDSASVTVHIPNAAEFKASGKLTSQSVTVNYDQLCFFVNAKGSGIASTSKGSCDIDRGVMGGGVPPGSDITMDIPGGDNRTIEVYGYLRNSASDACPPLPVDGWGAMPLTKIYFLGQTPAVTIAPPLTQVSVTIALPDSTQNLVVQNSWPVTCSGGALPGATKHAGRLQVGAAALSSTHYKLSARIADHNEGQILTSSHYRIQGKLHGP